MFSVPFLNNQPARPKKDYLVALSTPHGIMQHTMYNLPDPEHGYSTDDNARALLVAHLWKNYDRDQVSLMRNLESGYLRFLKFAQNNDGQFFCFVGFDLQKKDLGIGDWFGRAIFSLAFLSFYSKKFAPVSRNIVFKSLPIVKKENFSLRTIALLTLALYYLLKANAQDNFFKKAEVNELRQLLKGWRNALIAKIEKHGVHDWYWPEESITYDNGKIIQAYLIIGEMLNDKKMVKYGTKMLDFYTNLTFKKGYFQAPGNQGFWPHHSKKSLFDEQCLEAYSSTAAYISAFKVTGEKKYYRQALLCYKWFFGKNRLNKSLVDERSGAVFDGLQKDSINDNQGAESLLSHHLAYFAITKKIHL